MIKLSHDKKDSHDQDFTRLLPITTIKVAQIQLHVACSSEVHGHLQGHEYDNLTDSLSDEISQQLQGNSKCVY